MQTCFLNFVVYQNFFESLEKFFDVRIVFYIKKLESVEWELRFYIFKDFQGILICRKV